MAITVTGHLYNASGVGIPGSVVFQLVGYGNNIPRVIGTNAICPTLVTAQAASDGSFSISITGNDTIDPGAGNTPPTTYYLVSFRDQNGNVIQIVPFNFTGAGPNNLDSQALLNPIPSPVPIPNNAALVGANNDFTGNNTFQGFTTLGDTYIGQLAIQNLEGILFADQFAGADIGAQINAAYAAAPAAPSCTRIWVPQGVHAFTTPIVMNTVGKYAILQGSGSAQGSVISSFGGTVLNYTPTTGAAITLDWTYQPNGGGFAPGAGIRNLDLVNNPASLVNGGSGSSAVGISIGPANGGAQNAKVSDVRVAGFGTGILVTDSTSSSWGMTFDTCVIAWNNIGMSVINSEEQLCYINCKFMLNGVGLNFADTSAATDVTCIAGSFDGNITMGVECNAAGVLFNAMGTHWENLGISGTPNYFHGTSSTLSIQSGLALNDNATGTAGSWFTSAATLVDRLEIFSGGATQTSQIFFVGNVSNISIFDNSPTPIPLNQIAYTGPASTLEVVSQGSGASNSSKAICLLNLLSTTNNGSYVTLTTGSGSVGGILTVPSFTDTLAVLGHPQTWTATQTFGNLAQHADAFFTLSNVTDSDHGIEFARSDITREFVLSQLASGNGSSAGPYGLQLYSYDGTTFRNYLFFNFDGSTHVGSDLILDAGGLVVGTATGGNEGAGTINVASGVYLNGTAYTNPDYVFEKAFTGKIEKFKDNPGARGYNPLTLQETEAYCREYFQLPRVGETREMFARADILLEKVEELYLHVFNLADENKELKGRVAALESHITAVESYLNAKYGI